MMVNQFVVNVMRKHVFQDVSNVENLWMVNILLSMVIIIIKDVLFAQDVENHSKVRIAKLEDLNNAIVNLNKLSEIYSIERVFK